MFNRLNFSALTRSQQPNRTIVRDKVKKKAEKKRKKNLRAPKNRHNFATLFRGRDLGRLAQLVQSVCLTSRGSGVRIPQRPPTARPCHHRHGLACVFPRRTPGWGGAKALPLNGTAPRSWWGKSAKLSSSSASRLRVGAFFRSRSCPSRRLPPLQSCRDPRGGLRCRCGWPAAAGRMLHEMPGLRPPLRGWDFCQARGCV